MAETSAISLEKTVRRDSRAEVKDAETVEAVDGATTKSAVPAGASGRTKRVVIGNSRPYAVGWALVTKRRVATVAQIASSVFRIFIVGALLS
jgi:predicted RNA-binding Zn ribbon-like protein